MSGYSGNATLPASLARLRGTDLLSTKRLLR